MSIYSVIYTTTSNIIPNRDCTGSNHRSEHAGTILHTPTDKQAIHCFNSGTYITNRQQELRTCKGIGYEFYYEELFVVKHKSKYSCKCTIYFKLNSETIKENCKFNFYYNKLDITSNVLDGGNKIVLANWPNNKHIICNIKNDIPIMIPSHPYALVNRSVLHNCCIDMENHFLLEFLAACQDTNSKLVVYFTVNTVFINYLDHFPNLTESLEFPIIKNKTTFEQVLSIPLNISKSDPTLLTTSSDLKEFIHWYTNDK